MAKPDEPQPSFDKLRKLQRLDMARAEFVLALKAIRPLANKQELQKVDHLLNQMGLTP